MKETLILIKVQGVIGGDGVPRICIAWYLKGGNPAQYDGSLCCDDLDEALKHVKLAIEGDQEDAPERAVQTATQADIAGALPKKETAEDFI